MSTGSEPRCFVSPQRTVARRNHAPAIHLQPAACGSHMRPDRAERRLMQSVRASLPQQERTPCRAQRRSRPATADDMTYQDDTVRVPVTAERVEVTKEPRVVEE